MEFVSARRANELRLLRSELERFWTKINTDGPTPSHCSHLGPCWLWTANPVRGYGQFVLSRERDGRQPHVYAHRLIYQLVHGALPSPQIKVCHHCDNPLCCRPSHLFHGTQQENLDDARAKGRLDMSRPRTRLDGFTPQQRLDIFDMPARRGLVTDLARQFGVSKACISAIRKGRFVRLAPDSEQQRLQASPAPLLDVDRAAEILGRVFERVPQRQLPVLDILSPEIGMV